LIGLLPIENSAWTASDYPQTNRQTLYPAGRLLNQHYQPTDTPTAALSIRVFTYQYKTNSKDNNYKASLQKFGQLQDHFKPKHQLENSVIKATRQLQDHFYT
jgi:hypothetical protein